MNAPWKWSEDGLQLLDGEGRSILRIRPSDATQEEFSAIVAVPDLIMALEEVATACEGRAVVSVCAFLGVVLAAIAKAKGASS